jgi:hypothetical protein
VQRRRAGRIDDEDRRRLAALLEPRHAEVVGLDMDTQRRRAPGPPERLPGCRRAERGDEIEPCIAARGCAAEDADGAATLAGFLPRAGPPGRPAARAHRL